MNKIWWLNTLGRVFIKSVNGRIVLSTRILGVEDKSINIGWM